MDLSNLKPAKGSVKNKIRKGRGQGSGRGGTSTRGHKGQKSRSGYSKQFGFEGGQMPLQRRVPKFGFKNINRKVYRGINLDVIQKLAESKKLKAVDPEVFVSNGMAGKNDLIKILGRGTLKVKLEVTAHQFSASAAAAIESAGGKAISLEAATREKVTKKQPASKTNDQDKKKAGPADEKKSKKVAAETKEKKVEKDAKSNQSKEAAKVKKTSGDNEPEVDVAASVVEDNGKKENEAE